jgi:hypothetical protein
MIITRSFDENKYLQGRAFDEGFEAGVLAPQNRLDRDPFEEGTKPDPLPVSLRLSLSLSLSLWVVPLRLIHGDSGGFVSHSRERLVGKAEWQSRSKRGRDDAFAFAPDHIGLYRLPMPWKTHLETRRSRLHPSPSDHHAKLTQSLQQSASQHTPSGSTAACSATPTFAPPPGETLAKAIATGLGVDQ